MAERRVGMAWYEAAAYPRVRAIMEDGAKLPVDYAAWRLSAEQVEGEVARSGVRVIRVPIEPEAFLLWCDRAGSRPNGAARARYADEASRTVDDGLVAGERAGAA